jgi:hypothetical protein
MKVNYITLCTVLARCKTLIAIPSIFRRILSEDYSLLNCFRFYTTSICRRQLRHHKQKSGNLVHRSLPREAASIGGQRTLYPLITRDPLNLEGTYYVGAKVRLQGVIKYTSCNEDIYKCIGIAPSFLTSPIDGSECPHAVFPPGSISYEFGCGTKLV